MPEKSMADSIITKQELIDAQKDAQTLEEVISGEPGKLVETRLGRKVYTLASVPQINTMTREEINTGIASRAPQATTYTKIEVDSALSQKAPQSNTYTKAEVDTTFAAYVGGRKAFTTLALAQAAQSSLPADTAIEITNDGANNGTYQWNGTTLTKSAYDPLTQSKLYADQTKVAHTDMVVFKKNGTIVDADTRIYPDYGVNVNFDIENRSVFTLAVTPVVTGQELYFYNSAKNYNAGSGYGVVFFTDDPRVNESASKVSYTAQFVGDYLTVIVPDTARYVAYNVKYNDPIVWAINEGVAAQDNSTAPKKYFYAYKDLIIEPQIPQLARQAIENSNYNLGDLAKSATILTFNYLDAVGHSQTNGQSSWKLLKMYVEEGSTYYFKLENYAKGDYGDVSLSSSYTTVNSASLIRRVSPVATNISDVYSVTVPSGLGIVALFFNVALVIGVENYDYTATLSIQKDTYSPDLVGVKLGAIASLNNYPLMDTGARKQIKEILSGGVSQALNNKVWVAIGDSITERNFRSNNNYHDFIVETCTNLVVHNYGISATGYKDRYDVADTITQNPDVITVFWGTNDWGFSDTPLGEFLDTSTSTISGRINRALSKLIDKFPTATIAVITPLPRSDNHGSNANNNSQGYTLEQLSELIIKYAKHYSLPYLDLYHESNLPVWTAAGNAYYFTAPSLTEPDGLHPNDAGQQKMAGKIKAFINSAIGF